MAEHYQTCRFPNGFTVLVESVPGVRSAAYSLLIPAGSMFDAPDTLGAANLVSDWASRESLRLDSRALADELDGRGVQRTESAEIRFASFHGACLAEHLPAALEILAETLRTPRLSEVQFEFCQAGCLQELEALEDEPGQKLFVELRKLALPPPLGQPTLGTRDTVEGLTPAAAAAFHAGRYRPDGAILGVAGAVDFAAVRELALRAFGDWPAGAAAEPSLGTPPGGRGHVAGDKNQTHLALAFPSVPYADPDFYAAHAVASALGGGMSSRLFAEVREKRGLCYSVSASYYPFKDRGMMLCYAGSTNERAQETLAVIRGELARLPEGISAAELARAKIGLKTALVMQEESTSARAGVLARSWYHLGRVRSLAEIAAAVDALTPAAVTAYLERWPPRNFVLATLGPQPLEMPA